MIYFKWCRKKNKEHKELTEQKKAKLFDAYINRPDIGEILGIKGTGLGESKYGDDYESQLEAEVEGFEEKLKIAKEALTFYAKRQHYNVDDVDIKDKQSNFIVNGFVESGYIARKALKKIKEIKSEL